MDLWGALRPFQRLCKVRHITIIILRGYVPPFSLWSYLHWWYKSKGEENHWHLSTNKAKYWSLFMSQSSLYCLIVVWWNQIHKAVLLHNKAGKLSPVWQMFSQNWTKPVTKRTILFVAYDKISSFRQKSEWWQTCSHHYELDGFSILKSFSMNSDDIYDIFISSNETYHRRKSM